MHRGGPMGKPFDHRPPRWIRQSRKCCTQTIHNHMVVDFMSMSSTIFAIPEPCLIHLMMKVRSATAQQHEPPRFGARIRQPEECGLFLEPVLDAPPAHRASDLCHRLS